MRRKILSYLTLPLLLLLSNSSGFSASQENGIPNIPEGTLSSGPDIITGGIVFASPFERLLIISSLLLGKSRKATLPRYRLIARPQLP